MELLKSEQQAEPFTLIIIRRSAYDLDQLKLNGISIVVLL